MPSQHPAVQLAYCISCVTLLLLVVTAVLHVGANTCCHPWGFSSILVSQHILSLCLYVLCCSLFFQVLCYQEQQWVAGLDGKPEETSPFVATVMTDWMARMLCDLGHGAAVMLDTTFGTNKYMVGLGCFVLISHVASYNHHRILKLGSCSKCATMRK